MISPAQYRTIRDYLKHSSVPKVLVFRIGCHYRRQLEHYLAGLGVGGLNQMEFGTIDGIIGCVAAGLGVSLLPRSVVERSARRREVRIHTLPRSERYVETQFVTHRAQVRSLALEQLTAVIQSDKTAQRRA